MAANFAAILIKAFISLVFVLYKQKLVLKKLHYCPVFFLSSITFLKYFQLVILGLVNTLGAN